jgi:malonate transporter
MSAVLQVTVPFFALVLCGYVAVARRWLPLESIPGLNAFVLFFALPCMLFRFGATTPIAQSLDPAVMAVYLLSALGLLLFTTLLSRGPRIGWTDAAFGALVAAFPNTGYMGVPLLVALLGAPAAGPAIATMLVDLIVTSSLAIALSQFGTAGAHGAAAAARRALRGVLTNPLPWAILAGAASSAFAMAPPAPLMTTIGLAADAAGPVALFTIGAVLARAQHTGAAHVAAGDVLSVALIKLLLHPLLVLALGVTAIGLGLPLSPFALTVIVLVAALPSASNVAMLAERYGADGGRIARIILVSTAAAFATFSAAVALLA